ncbi:MAG: DUF2304 domain-containing protein [Bifidobacteriaceae bacterium]|jgi:hypothetical protein|nr:DUF2304 domain-containing protein [Bifidobacteriaceae bacterium]
MVLRIVGIVVAALLVAVVLRLVARGRLDLRYATLWLGVGTVLVVVAAWPRLLEWLAEVLGFEVPANLLLTTAFVLLFLISLQLSAELTRVEARMQRLTEELVLLRAEADERGSGGENEAPSALNRDFRHPPEDD